MKDAADATRIPFAPELKVPAITEYIGDRPALWIDDQLISWRGALRQLGPSR